MIRVPGDGWARARLPVMDCGHPLSARRVAVKATGPRAEDRYLVTECWACTVQREVVSKIVGPKAAKRRDGAA